MLKKEFIFFIVPSIFIVALITIFPSIYTIYMSFSRETVVAGTVFIGLENYKTILNDARFWTSLGNTFFFIVIVIPAQILIGFILALLLDKVTRIRSFFTGTLLLPYIIVPVVAALSFGWIFRGNFGILNYFITSLGLKPPNWFSDPLTARFLIMIFEIWKNMPFVLIILFAGLQGLPAQVEEAGDIDGANYMQKLIHLKIPLLKNHIFFILTIVLMNSFQTFDSIYVLTGGGPGTNTYMLAFYNYIVAFGEYDIGKSSAIAILSIFIISIVLAYFLIEVYKQYQEQTKVKNVLGDAKNK